MTCIIGQVHDGDVYMGADSCDGGDYISVVARNLKVFRKGGVLVGYTTSWRMGQLLQFKMQIPEHPKCLNAMEYMVTCFVDAVRECLKVGGFAYKKDGVEAGGEFLVGYRGKLFAIGEDYEVVENSHDFRAVGCGQEYAMGAMHAASHLAPRKRIRAALAAAATFSPGVRGPFHVLKLGKGKG